MSNKAIKIGLTVAVLAVALTGLLRATLREGTEYYKHVDEVLVNPAEWQGKNLQLHGYVVRDSILRKRDSLEYRFKVTSKVGDGARVVSAHYTGIVPDTFSDDAEVVLKGKLEPDGFHVVPNGVMAKCPSKYRIEEEGSWRGRQLAGGRGLIFSRHSVHTRIRFLPPEPDPCAYCRTGTVRVRTVSE